MREKEVRVLDSTMHTIETGAGDPIVFLHGNPTSSFLWRNVIPRLESDGLCIAPDLIGMGRSGKPKIPYRYIDHERYLDAWFEAMDVRSAVLVIHDWGSTLGVSWARRHAHRVAGIAMMEAILEALPWSEFPKDFIDIFKTFRTPGEGEKLILEKNFFVERILPGAVIRKLTDDEMNVYRAPFPDPESRRPTLQWPRELPIEGEPRDVIEVVRKNAAFLAESDIPKLLLTFEPGALVTERAVARLRSAIRNLKVRKIGPGIHFVQEDHPQAIGDAVKEWMRMTVRKNR